MSQIDPHFYHFQDLRLDTTERSLFRNDERIAITPKVYAMLLILVRNSGRIVEKDELIREIWPDRFVEESNLTFNMRRLRQVLGDDATAPRFVETVPRRGYRFVAAVTTSDDAESRPDPVTATERRSSGPQLRGRLLISAALASVLLFVLAGAGFWYFSANVEADHRLATPVVSERLSTNGGVFQAVISPDGRYIALTNSSAGKQGLWLRQIESGTNLEIVPAMDSIAYGALAFSPQGDHIYFTRYPKESGPSALYKVPVMGGAVKLILNNAKGRISLSRDGSKVSFVRCRPRPENDCALMIADAADGQNERELVRRESPMRIGGSTFSRDGRSLVFALGQSENQANDFSIAHVDIDSGTVTDFSSQRFFDVRSLTWMSNGRDLIVAASRIPNRNFRLWKVPPGAGSAEPLTSESESFGSVSLDNSGETVVVTQLRDDYTLTTYNSNEPANSKALASASVASYAPDGRIVFSSAMLGNLDIWTMNKDGSDQRQLTTDQADDSSPIVGPHGDVVFFTSNRSGSAHIWRMNADGSDQRQITSDDGGVPLLVSSDSAWVYYRSAISRRLRRIGSNGGDEEPVSDRPSFYPALTPDGSRIAYITSVGPKRSIEIISSFEGRVLQTLYAPDNSRVANLLWSPDGKSLYYILSAENSAEQSFYQHPINGGEPRKIVDLGENHVESVSISPDGNSFAIVQGQWLHDAVLLKGLK